MSSFHGNFEHYPHNRNSHYINDFNDMSSMNLTYEQQQLHFSKQSQMVVGVQNLPVNPNLMKFNEQELYKLQEIELQSELRAANSGSFSKARAQKFAQGGQTNPWNHNPTEYKVYYPLAEFME
jgi:hypothetical protein